jgi:uncharacterized membrane protein YccC
MADQMAPSDRVKTAMRTALAMVLAYGIALSMDWSHPYWAAFSVAFCTLSTVNESLDKGLLRLAGTLVGSVAALTLIALFPQDRWLFLIAMSVFTGSCVFIMIGKTHWYFWYVAGFSVPLLAFAGGANAPNDFETVILRTEETTLGILCYSLVWLMLWPNFAPAVEPIHHAVPLSERLARIARWFVGLWFALLTSLYVPDVPDTLDFVVVTNTISMAICMMPQVPVSVAFLPYAFGFALGSITNVLVMPHLTTFASLALVIFFPVFLICYLFSRPTQAIGKSAALGLFIIQLGVANEQTYNFLDVTNLAVASVMIFATVAVAWTKPREAF